MRKQIFQYELLSGGLGIIDTCILIEVQSKNVIQILNIVLNAAIINTCSKSMYTCIMKISGFYLNDKTIQYRLKCLKRIKLKSEFLSSENVVLRGGYIIDYVIIFFLVFVCTLLWRFD